MSLRSSVVTPQERRIRYPSTEEADPDPWNFASSSEEDWDCDRWTARTSASSPSTRVQSSVPHRQQGIPDTAGELVRYLSSDKYKKAQQDQWEQLRGMYEVLQSSPWVQSKPVHILGVLEQGSETALTHTLRARVRRQLATDMDKLFGGRKRADGNIIIQADDMRDGIIAFEDEEDAERYGTLLQAETDCQVIPVQYDAHALFRTAQSVRAVVVWLPRGRPGTPPAPTMLAASLKKQSPVDE